MRKLILVKHARPQVVERIPSDQWTLSEEGRAACRPLAEALRAHDAAVIVTSDEAKAIETGKLVAEALDKPLETAAGLHEHDRSNVPMMQSSEFLSALALFFKQRDRLVLGKETAEQALRRFEQVLHGVLNEYDRGNIAVVTHGTVLALFAEKHGLGDGFSLYRKLRLPSFIVFDAEGFEPLETVAQIGP